MVVVEVSVVKAVGVIVTVTVVLGVNTLVALTVTLCVAVTLEVCETDCVTLGVGIARHEQALDKMPPSNCLTFTGRPRLTLAGA